MARDPQRMETKMRKLDPGTAGVRASGLDVETLRAIVEIVEKSDVSRLEWRRGDERLLIRRGPPPAPRPASMATLAPIASLPMAAVTSAPAVPAAAPAAAAPAPAAAADPKRQVVTSPFVGTFYRSPSPEAPVFVEQGQTVKKGQVLCIVEAMKLMNEIESEVAGRVVEILVTNGHAVEFGQPLFKIEPQ